MRIFTAFYLLLVLFSFVDIDAAEAGEKVEVNIAVLAHREKASVYSRWQPVAEHLNQSSDSFSFKIIPLYYDELEHSVANREVTFVLTNPSSFVYLQETYGLSSPLLTLINKVAGKHLKAFGGIIFTRSDNSDVNSVDDLAGRSVAIVSKSSLGGYQMQIHEMDFQAQGISTQLSLTETGMPHDNVVNSVLSGKTQAGFVRTGVLEQLSKSGQIRLSDIKIINKQFLPGYPLLTSTRLYPEWPLSALPFTDTNITRYVVAKLLALSPEQPVSLSSRIGGFDIPANYTSVTSLMREHRLPPFDKNRDISITEVWMSYKWILILILSLFCLLGAGYILLIRTNQKLEEARHDVVTKERFLNEIIWATKAGTWIWNITTSEMIFNNMWAEMLGYRLEELRPHTFETWERHTHPDDLLKAENALRKHLAGLDDVYHCEIRMKHKKGHWVWVLTRGSVVAWDDSKNPVRMSGTHTNITERKKLEAERENYKHQLEVIARTDSLTQLYTRRHFLETASKLFDIAQRYNQPLSFMMIDADFFKQINDTYGHNAGDVVLKAIAKLLQENLRQADVLARLGGEEFGLLMPETDIAKGFSIAERIVSLAGQAHVEVEGQSITFGLSIGVSSLNDSVKNISDLMIQADRALYEAKSSGRGMAKKYTT